MPGTLEWGGSVFTSFKQITSSPSEVVVVAVVAVAKAAVPVMQEVPPAVLLAVAMPPMLLPHLEVGMAGGTPRVVPAKAGNRAHPNRKTPTQ